MYCLYIWLWVSSIVISILLLLLAKTLEDCGQSSKITALQPFDDGVPTSRTKRFRHELRVHNGGAGHSEGSFNEVRQERKFRSSSLLRHSSPLIGIDQVSGPHTMSLMKIAAFLRQFKTFSGSSSSGKCMKVAIPRQARPTNQIGHCPCRMN